MTCETCRRIEVAPPRTICDACAITIGIQLHFRRNPVKVVVRA